MMKIIFIGLALTILVNGRPDNDFSSKLRLWGLNWSEANFKDLPRPNELVFQLSEDEFDDYLEFYGSAQFGATPKEAIQMKESACIVPINSLSEPQPAFISDGKLKEPFGNSETIQFTAGESMILACEGDNNQLLNDFSTQNAASASVVCESGELFSGPGWLSAQVLLGSIECSRHSPWLEGRTGNCIEGRGSHITIGVNGLGTRYDTLSSCFDEDAASVFYVEYDQTPENIRWQSGVARPSWEQGIWFPGMAVNTLYTQVSQKAAIASIVGSQLADVYVNATFFMARGHLAAKTDFVLSPPQRSTFTFLNCAPQWQPFNGGNWATLELNLRNRIGTQGYRTRIYTGTWEIMKLRDESGTLREIHLSPSDRKLPVPLWFYKVVHEPSTNRGIVYLGMNNPHVTLEEARELAFCTDVCLNDSRFNWLPWRIDDIGLGYVMCCDINDFRRTVDHLPPFTVNELLI